MNHCGERHEELVNFARSLSHEEKMQMIYCIWTSGDILIANYFDKEMIEKMTGRSFSAELWAEIIHWLIRKSAFPDEISDLMPEWIEAALDAIQEYWDE